MIVAYKYRIKDRSARKTLQRHAYAVNQVWNYCVAHQLDVENRYRAGSKPRKWANKYDFGRLVQGTGRELGIHQHTVSDVCDQFVINRNKIKRAPRFRSSFGSYRSRGWIPFQKQSRQIGDNFVTYRGKKYRYFGSNRRPLPPNAKGGAFTEDAQGRWFVYFYVEITPQTPIENNKIGIDLGLTTLATLSDGRKFKMPQFFRIFENKLAIAQRAKNKQRTKAIHIKIRNKRNDFLHKLSTGLADQNAIIAVGNVNASKLVQTRMAKSVYDASWSTFRRMLAYKAADYREVDERFTTQTCSHCGAMPPERPKGIAGLGIRQWKCSNCGEIHDRDVNAARNILAVALSAQRHGDESREVCIG